MMFSRKSNKFTLKDLVDLEFYLLQDQNQDKDPQTLQSRDRRIGKEIGASRLSREEALYRWVEERRKEVSGNSFGTTIDHGRRCILLLLTVLGIGTGAVTMCFCLLLKSPAGFNGRVLWWSFVGPLWGFLLFSALLLLPFSPLTGLRDALTWFFEKLGALLGWVLCLWEPLRKSLKKWRISFQKLQTIYGEIWKWQAISWLHIYKFSYTSVVLVAWIIWGSWYHPTFHWTSLKTEPEQVAASMWRLATPWRKWKPKAVPTLGDVQDTRSNRLEKRSYITDDDGPTIADVRWYDYIFYSILFYGFVPRTIFLCYSSWKLRSETQQLTFKHASAQELFLRMTTPEVSIRKNGPEDPPLPPQPPPPQPPPVVEKCVVLQWREVTLGHDQLKEILRSKQVSGVMEVCPFWGHLDDDDRTIKLLADTPGEVDIVAVIPARNTPMKAHIRIINDIRKAVGRDRPIAIMLWNVDVQGQPISANEKQLVMWRNKLNPLPDAYLSIHSLT